ncbi:MAG: TetR/AcrR family transcriptional regulator [Roseovarius sp.]|jgi:AcrR family transcriptional regulator|nr:TetR/AcrR family transcriptional regulator [Roseovarius sp.]
MAKKEMTTDPNSEDRGITRRDWVVAARNALIEKGISGVRLRALAETLGVTTGAFYWQYKNLEELLEDVRQDWAVTNTTPFAEAIEASAPDGWKQYLSYVRVLVLEDSFNARYDNAIRDWAHNSVETATVLRDIELTRIHQLQSVFENMGFDTKEAAIRARVTYFHQAGYNAMKIVESREERLANIPYYAKILTDRVDLLGLDTPEKVKTCLLSSSE